MANEQYGTTIASPPLLLLAALILLVLLLSDRREPRRAGHGQLLDHQRGPRLRVVGLIEPTEFKKNVASLGAKGPEINILTSDANPIHVEKVILIECLLKLIEQQNIFQKHSCLNYTMVF